MSFAAVRTITRREVTETLTDWRILLPIFILTFILPQLLIAAADLTELSQKMQFTERQWERAKALSQQLTHELFQSVEWRKGHGAKPNVVKLQPRRNNTRNSLIRADGKEYDPKESDQ